MIRFRPRAAREFAADVRRYEEQYTGRGQRFATAVDIVLARIDAAPDSFPLLVEPDIRSAKVARFPYRVVYLVVDGAIDVLAVAHARRRPGYWQRGR